MDERLKRLIARRDQAAKKREEVLAKRKAIVDLAEEEAREDLSTEEDTEFRSLTEQLRDLDEGNTERGVVGLKEYDERIAELAAEAERDAKVTEGAAAVRRAQARVESVNEGRIYEKGNGRSYLRDLVKSNPVFGLSGADEARERLQRHATDVATSKEFRDLDRGDGTGGAAVPPLWLMSDYLELARAGRATANLVTNMALPAGTDSINIPKMATGTATAVQTADNAAVQETDLTDTSISAGVKTIAGQEDLAIQLIDQSPINFDEVVFRDLVADYATKVDLQVIQGSNAAGQVKGILNAAGTEAVSLTAVGVKEFYASVADAVQRIHTLRFRAPSVIVMHPRRWAWLTAQVDTQNRPLIVPSGPGQNQLATFSGVVSQQVVGQMHGLPVVTDPNLPTNLGVSPADTEDTVLVMKADDLYLWESSIRTRVLPEVGSGNLTVRLQVYGYLAFTAERYPKSVAKIGGTGLVEPTF